MGIRVRDDGGDILALGCCGGVGLGGGDLLVDNGGGRGGFGWGSGYFGASGCLVCSSV